MCTLAQCVHCSLEKRHCIDESLRWHICAATNKWLQKEERGNENGKGHSIQRHLFCKECFRVSYECVCVPVASATSALSCGTVHCSPHHWFALCISAKNSTTTTTAALWLVVDCHSFSRCYCFKKKLHGNSVVFLSLKPLIWERVHWRLSDRRKQNLEASWDWDGNDWQGEQKRLSYLCFAGSWTLKVKDVMVWGTTSLIRINGFSRSLFITAYSHFISTIWEAELRSFGCYSL